MTRNVNIVLKNANVITFDAIRPRARYVAVSGDRIAGAGRDPEQAIAPGTRIIDCEGKTVIPGFIDSHCHIFSFVRKQLTIDLSYPGVRSISDIKEAIRRKVATTPPGEWINGSDYSDFYLAEKRHPTRQDLDEASPNNPVIISHR